MCCFADHGAASRRISKLFEGAQDWRSLMVAIGAAYQVLDKQCAGETSTSSRAVAANSRQLLTEHTLKTLSTVWCSTQSRIQKVVNEQEQLGMYLDYEFIRLWRRALKRLDEMEIQAAESSEIRHLFDGVASVLESTRPGPLRELTEWKTLKLFNTFITMRTAVRSASTSQFVVAALRLFSDKVVLASRFSVFAAFQREGTTYEAKSTTFIRVDPSSNATLRSFLLLILRIVRFAVTHFDTATIGELQSHIDKSVSLFTELATLRTGVNSRSTVLTSLLEQVFVEQDDDFVECLLLLLEVRTRTELDVDCESLLQTFVDAFSGDAFCVAELLVAPETRALEFVTKCLKSALVSDCGRCEEVDRVSLRAFVSDLREKLLSMQQRSQIPFNIAPLLQLMSRYVQAGIK